MVDAGPNFLFSQRRALISGNHIWCCYTCTRRPAARVTCQDHVKIDNIFDVERNVISNKPQKSSWLYHWQEVFSFSPNAARAVLHQQPLVKTFDDSHKRVFKLRYGRARSRLRSGLERGSRCSAITQLNIGPKPPPMDGMLHCIRP